MKKKVFAVLLGLPLCGCTVLPTAMEMTVSSAFNGVVTGMAQMSSTKKSYDHSHPRVTVNEVCLELNDRVSAPDFVPALQEALSHYHISSHLYGPGNEPSDCPAILYYAAARAWDRPMFSDELTPYLVQAQLVLRQHGEVVARAGYDLSQTHDLKWNTTQSKVVLLVDDLIFGGA